MNFGSVFLGALVLLAAIAGLTNPSEQDFADWARERVNERSVVAGSVWRDPEIARSSYVVASRFDVRLLDADVARCYGALDRLFVCMPAVGIGAVPGLSDVFG